ncbi:hypothetical protein BDK51DRAFT_31334 [Blyttiomyces helicus]|uniref:Uncharacterized protein n=1 Tax=Blyttiomyces helicus TaxID=388810 RepID=A0A4P9WLV1_9FUNG|nr:hypothetical protein BDK51DRAFT_31334 [Blyttiomyces helicus]|eukprot:RKO93402.1 hypothetical protein BDK51DRAFT_31334 [Blyttiomyces helicus]
MQFISFVAVAVLASAALATPVPQFGGNFGPGPVSQITVAIGKHCSTTEFPKRVCDEPAAICKLTNKEEPSLGGVCIRNPAVENVEEEDAAPSAPSAPDLRKIGLEMERYTNQRGGWGGQCW